MGLFENLFKPRPDGTLERIVEAPLRASGLAERAPDAEGEAAPDPDTIFLQPKGYAPGATKPGLGAQNQGFVPVLPAAKRAPAPERRPATADPAAAAPSMVVLTVGDVLPRIPVSFLRPGPRDLKRELRFHIHDLASDITRGRPAIALSCIAEQAPELFHSPISDADDMAIRLPLQKLVEQVGRIRSHTPAPSLHVVQPPARAPGPAPLEKRRIEIPAPPPVVPVVEKIVAPIPPRIVPAPVVAAPVVAVPAPVPAASVVVAPVKAEPAPVVTETKSVLTEPAPVVTETKSVLTEPASVLTEPASVFTEPASVAAERPPVEAERPPVEAERPPAAPEPPPATTVPVQPERVADIAPPESVIDLSLAAIVAKLPRALIAGPLPPIAENERISLPFPLIERQLGTGAVEVPARLFWSALPLLFRPHFLVRDDIAVPVPLEEIFQNLPVGGAAERPRFEPASPAPAAAPDLAKPVAPAPEPAAETTPELSFAAPPPAVVAEPAAPAPPPPVAPVLAPLVEPEAPVAVSLAPLVPPPAPAPPEVVAVPAAPEAAVLAPPSSAETSEPPIDSAPAEAAAVQLQPFRVFQPPTPSVEPEPETPSEQPFLLPEVPALAPPVEPLHLLQPAAEEDEAPVAPAAETAPEPDPAPPPAPEPPVAPAPHFSVLPAPARAPEPVHVPAAAPPEPEPLVAFTPDQPPPLKIETPAAAVAVLRATAPAPPELPAVAMAAGSVQPPRLFRPVVLAPPISGFAAAAPVNLAPTLSGPGSTEGMISLSPAAGPHARGFTSLAAAPSEPPRPPEPAPVLPPEPANRESLAPPAAQAEAVEAERVTPVAPAVPIPEPVAAVPEVSPAAPPPVMPTLRSVLAEPVASPLAASSAAPATILAPIPLVSLAKPAAAKPEPDAAAALTPHLPPIVQNLPAEPAPAPPALPLGRFDQHSLQSLFMTDETLDLPQVSRLAAGLPGMQGCVIVARGESYSGGLLPEGFHLNALRGLAPQVGAAADRLPIGELKNFTLYGEQYSVSFFERRAVCLCAVHRARSFVPGVREKLVAVVEELARG